MDKQRRKRPALLVIVLVVLLGGGFLSYKMITREESKQKFRMVKVERGEIRSTVTATGTINPVTMVSVGSQVSGTIKALYADFELWQFMASREQKSDWKDNDNHHTT